MSPSARDEIQLHLLRHADAGDPGAWHGDDSERPLSDKGHAQADRLAQFLVSTGFRTDAIITSPKVRARQTAEIVAAALGIPVRLEPRLAEGFDPDLVDGVLRDSGSPRRPVLVGHDPDFSELLGFLAGTDALTMKKGSFARLDVRGPVGGGSGTLRWLVPPDLLDSNRR